MSRPLLFCPFCRECFEGEELCPEHELPLVPFDRLPARRETGPAPGEPVPLHELRYGRGWLLLAAVLWLSGMALPLVTTSDVDRSVTATGYDLATGSAPNLWIVPAVAGALISVLMRRRTPSQMRGSRIAVPALALMVIGSVVYTLWRIRRAAAVHDLEVTLHGAGVGVLVAGVVIAILGGIRLGTTG